MRLEKMLVIPVVLGVALVTGACAENTLDLWQNSHRAEGPGFGDNHRQILAKHIVNPEPAKPNALESAVEAERMSPGMQDYMSGTAGGDTDKAAGISTSKGVRGSSN